MEAGDPEPGMRLLFSTVGLTTSVIVAWATPAWESLAQAKALPAVERLLPAARGSGPEGPPQTVSTFAGREYRCRWLIREPAEKPLKIQLDLFQMLASTVAPIEKDIVLAEKARAEPGQPLEVEWLFQIPESDRPLRYLLKLWIESGEEKKAAAILIVRAVPPGILSRLEGRTISLFGFGKKPAGWRSALETAGVTLKHLEEAPDGESPGVTFVTAARDEENPPKKPGRLSGGRRMVFFEKEPSAHAAAILRQAGEGWVITAGMDLLDQLPDSPEAQEFLIHLLTFENTQPDIKP